MKTLVSVAVFGLVPVPCMTSMLTSSRRNLEAASEDVELWELVFLPDATERMVTKEEIARIRDELEAITRRAA